MSSQPSNMLPRAIAWPIKSRSADIAVKLLDEIVWTFGKPEQVLADNGAEFVSDEFTTALKRYGIKPKHTSPGHPQTNGKVERWNLELVERLQRISAEKGNKLEDWDLYIRQALFAFHAHTNARLGASPFFLQYGVEPVLPSQPVGPATNAPSETTRDRKQQAQDLSKYRTAAAQKYQTALGQLATSRDDKAFLHGPIIPGDLVMRAPLNRKSKLHPKWDGPFVVLASTDKDVYQLATANGHILNNLTNEIRLRKLTLDEVKNYRGEFWEASKRLKAQDERAQQQQRMHDLDVELRKAMLKDATAKKHGHTHSKKNTEISSKQRRLAKQMPPIESAPATTSASTRSGRAIRLPSRFKD